MKDSLVHGCQDLSFGLLLPFACPPSFQFLFIKLFRSQEAESPPHKFGKKKKKRRRRRSSRLAMAHTMLPPLSPLSQYINTPVLTFYVLGVCELETPFTKAQTLQFVEHGLIPINKRFSSIIVTDEKGVQRWKKIECCVEDHVIVPTFPSGLSPEEYDEKLEEYLSDIAMKQIPETRPPWEVHLIVYPTTKGEGSLVFKINHAIGDGYSFMGALFALFKRADNPSIALKYPTASSRLPGLSSNYSKVSTFVYRCINTVSDLTRGVLGMYLEDDHTILRSKTPGVEYAPVNINSVTYSLEDIRQVRTKIGATVNDVTTGIIAYALQLYMKRMGQIPLETKSTGLIVMNLRMYRGFKSLDEMLKANIWGNHFGFLRVSLPSFGNLDEVDPLEYIQRSKSEMQKQMNSMANYFTTKLLYVLGTIRGPEAAATYLHSNLRNTSIMITNMCGPTEQASIAGHPLKHFYFTVPGVPQSIVFTIVSYMGTLRLVATTEKGFIDSQVLVSCMKEAFQKMYIAATGEDLVKFH